MQSVQQGPSFPRLVQRFFTEFLGQQRDLSAHTIASYRDTFRLLLRYIQEQRGKRPSALALADLDASIIGGFLDSLEQRRGNAARTRNQRLGAIRSFLHYAAHQEPSALETIQRVQAIPSKRYEQPLLGYLTSEEIQAILEAPNQETWSGARDHAMWATFYNTGARVSEITGMRIADLDLSAAALVRIRGKGRKQRQVPLWRTTRQILARWRERVSIEPSTPVFPNRQGQPLTRSGVEERLRCAVRNATEHVPTLARVHVTPHTLRHTTAMHLLQSGIDITVIALWLGHESIETTHKYIEADLEMKRRTLASLEEPTSRSAPRAPTDDLVAFLDSL